MNDFEFLNEKQSRRFGDDYVRALIVELRRAGKNSSGSLINSLDYRLQDTAKEIQFLFDANDYFKNVDEGRKPGSYPPIKEIARWASAKGISKDAVYPIAKSIYRFGIKPANIFQKANNKVMNGKIFDDMESNIASNVEDEIVEQLEKLNDR